MLGPLSTISPISPLIESTQLYDLRHSTPSAFSGLKALLGARGMRAEDVRSLLLGNHEFGKTTGKKLLQLCPKLQAPDP